ncbi:hypothetical protein FXO38_00336 [Capsicum annuum]|nr:hypothetical protein FXO37_16031 [Capsicum annuum]KAF3684359.1 hypothetical protein FXO38_00336 [Capsicum annuum]
MASSSSPSLFFISSSDLSAPNQSTSISGKGYGVSKGTFNRVIERFEKEEMSGHVKKLKELYASSELVDNSSENVYSKVCKLIRENVWGDDGETIVGALEAAMVISGGRGGG